MNTLPTTEQILSAAHERDMSRQEQFRIDRTSLREKLMVAHLLDPTVPLHFEGGFQGYGDSGQYENDSGNDEVDKLFSDAVDIFVTFDWYNNEGGGGDLTWDVKEDKLTINGYYNEVQQVSMMSEEEV